VAVAEAGTRCPGAAGAGSAAVVALMPAAVIRVERLAGVTAAAHTLAEVSAAARTRVVVTPGVMQGAVTTAGTGVVMADTGAAFMDVPITATGSALALVSGSGTRIMATVTAILTAIRPDTTAIIALPVTATATATN